MRISGGKARGITLTVPKGDSVRPATDGTRQAVFSSLASRLPGARFLDLFAGSGSYGFEALSRGAAGGIAVERNPKALACLKANRAAVAKSVGVSESAVEILPVDVLAWKPAPLKIDLVFIDPPYALIEEIAPALFQRLAEWLPVDHDPLIIFEMPGELELTGEPGWELIKKVGRGGPRQPTISIYRRRLPTLAPGTQAQ